MNLKQKIKQEHPKIFAVLKAVKLSFDFTKFYISRGPFGYRTIAAKFGVMKRKYFPNLPSRYSRVKSLKNIHAGEKCFIVATGPSLTLEDLNMLKGRLCISVNSIITSYNKTDWRPDYYVIIDGGVARNIINGGGG